MRRLSCLLFGHRVNDLQLGVAAERRCACGAAYLDDGGAVTRIRHTVSCFVFGHRYHRIAERAGHHEYLCGHCGHTLLFAAADDPFAPATSFTKQVRYLCNLLGHPVHLVTTRDGLVEYACHCGHSFLKERQKVRPGGVIAHPPVCTYAGHDVRFVTNRDGHAEYRCTACGHPFCFPLAAAGGESTLLREIGQALSPGFSS